MTAENAVIQTGVIAKAVEAADGAEASLPATTARIDTTLVWVGAFRNSLADQGYTLVHKADLEELLQAAKTISTSEHNPLRRTIERLESKGDQA